MDFKINAPTDCDVKIKLEEDKNNISFYRICINGKNNSENGSIYIEWEMPLGDAFSVWNSNARFNCSLQPNWNKSIIKSRGASGAPVQELVSMSGDNSLCIAVSDVKNPIEIQTGVIEESGEIQCRIYFFKESAVLIDKYEAVIRVDRRKIPFYNCLNEVGKWWENLGGYTENIIPDAAYMPVYSTWYSFHQSVNPKLIVNQCRIAKKLGMETVIIDDGWQTCDNNRGYAYCGDWEVAKEKIPDMKMFISDIHKSGMKAMLWYCVPFVGVYSNVYKKFDGKFLYVVDGKYGCLDPRYKDVRDYLIGIYEKAVLEWNLDGLKLDFIDSFKLESFEEDENRDIRSLEDAVERLLSDIKDRLSELKEDICIEFRQSYVGPMMAHCGNMLRVGDSPADSIKNRRGSADIRLICGKTPVHSDMLMWDYSAPVESAALQIINSIFCVPQISMMLDKLSKEHYDMLKFYMNFWKENKETLMRGNFKPENPESNYSMLSSEYEEKKIAVGFSKNVFTYEGIYKELYFINGTGGDSLILKSNAKIKKYLYLITDCMGNTIKKGTGTNTLVREFKVPPAGILKIVISQ